ncbi:MAG: flagellar hook-basal body complex protein [Cellvibrio sp.]|uniref:flagellar hook-basal body complex protein n=1 Tax=Cellvibrio sp. TaxID=1965322 RepID=UPI00271AFC1E|nr:flagellar hook-basal body complex protein [Cellvibrio sp.]
MSFNTALSGIRAANTDLQVTGNNIANASTIGFKSSRAEFGDVYSSTLLGGGSNTAGSGVTIQNIRQQFTQGNLKFTQNELDLSVNGEGFFVVEKNGERLYTRAGTFGLDKDGYIVNGTNALLQGFAADVDGNVSGILSDLRVDVSSQEPRQTTGVDASYNLDSNELVLETTGTRFATNGTGISNATIGLKVPTTSTVDIATATASAGTPIVIAGAPAAVTEFLLSRTVPGNPTPQTVNIVMTPGTYNNLTAVANEINNQNFSKPVPLNVQAYVDTDGRLKLRDLATGVGSALDITTVTGANGLTAAVDAIAPANITVGEPQVTNDYASHTLVFQGPNNSAPVTYISKYGAGADETASELNSLAGVTATARTTATILREVPAVVAPPTPAKPFDNNTGTFTLNGVVLTSSTAADMTDLAEEINNLSKSTLFGITATVNELTGDLEVVSATGRDLEFSFGAAGDVVGIIGNQGVLQEIDTITDPTLVGSAINVGGQITITMQEGYSIASSQPTTPVNGGILFGAIGDPTFFTPVPINAFDPNDQKTFNHATTTPVYDSLGNVHSMRQFFVKQSYDPADPTTSPNHWKMYVQIDGQNVGDPDPTLPSPQNIEPTMASFNVHFTPEGTIDDSVTDAILISNWTPIGADGAPIGALGPLNILQGGTIPVAEPPASSNFMIDLEGSTQFGSVFSVEELDQNGYATGRLAGLDISNTGIVFARFTNGEAQVLGQVALANFSSTEGLKPTGDTMWAQTFESGEAIVGAPGSAQLGNITAGAVEESNVDLSEQLVNLIIAQRNYQANAKTIETANATTQTILNLR